MNKDPQKQQSTEEIIEIITKEKDVLKKKISFLKKQKEDAKGVLEEELDIRILQLEKVEAQRTIYLMELEFERDFI